MLQVITCTGARPFAWRLCQQYMRRQTYTGPVRWVIVDDGLEPAIIERQPDNVLIEIIRPRDLWQPGMRTNARNLALALDACNPDLPTVIVEDDDWYSREYVAHVAVVMQRETMAGQAICAKFNIRTGRYRFNSYPHASLCCTAVRGEHFHRLREILRGNPKLPDLPLWKSGGGLLYPGLFVVGMKGLPGRAGIDSGHSPTYGVRRDPAKLRQWIGNDAENYAMQNRDDEIQQYVKAYQRPEYRMGCNRRRCVDRILRGLERGSLLDVGTGRGETLAMAQGLGHQAMGTEVVPELIRDGVVYSPAHRLPFPDAAFDHVTCFDVLEHLTRDDLLPALREMRRVARKTVTASASEVPSIHEGRDLHISAMPAADWEALIRQAWGDCVRIQPAGRSPCWQLVIQS